MSNSRKTLVNTYYSDPWSRNVERIVLGKLEREVERGNWWPGMFEQNYNCVRIARNEMAREHGLWIGLKEYFLKIDEWDTRYHNFEWLVNHDEIVYNEDDNKVIASKMIWDEIGQERPELLIYREEGEPHWNSLKTLFREIIVISSKSESEASGISEEVNQPRGS